MTTDTGTLPTQSPSHSMTLAWIVIWAFGIAGLFLFGLAFEAALYLIFGGLS